MTSKLTITREQLTEWVAQLDCDGGCDATDKQLEALIRQSLAAMDSEPVAWLWSRDDERDVSLTPPDDDDDAADAIECGWTATPLYRHAQQPVDSEPVGYFRRYDPDFDALITQCDKGAQDSFPLYLHGQSEPIGANIARDAQRYRFLRDKDAFGDDGEPGLASWDELIELDMNEFDAAIDARMAHPSVDFLSLDNALQEQERRRCKDRNCNKQIFGYSVDGLCEDCYAAVSQQPAPVVPEEKPMPNTLSMYAVDAVAAIAEVKGWNACRAAMLNHPSRIQPNTDAAPGTEIKHPSSNSPVIPEGWQVEAGKLAEMHGMSFVLFRNGEEPQCADPTKVVISFTDKGLGHDTLPAAPQEVKGD
ncbi:TPA: hypothetical protein PIT96_002791 [Klebsiella michiganensis]|nr:hypothetical protein [Klebsiella michiganensis]